MSAPELPLILLVDDEPRSLEAMRRTLDEDFSIVCAGSADEALRQMARQAAAVVLCDQRMPGTTGVELLRTMRAQWPQAVRIIVSGYSDSADIVSGINDAGIHQYLLKPWVPDHLLQVVRDAADAACQRQSLARLDIELRQGAPALRARRATLQAQAAAAFGFDRIARAAGSPLEALCDTAARIARVDLSVLLTGESGTGKELVARAIHYASPRADGPFVVENCAAIADTLLESELFGHKRGAFTGAVDDHVGLVARAHGGTLFLDEIGETSPAFQVKLLRVLQEGELRPVGSVRAVPVDVRIVAATHRDLEADVIAGRFREDLYYRLAGVTLLLPPLRQRIGDIAAIAERLLAQVGAELGRPGLHFTDGTPAALLDYPWPGNIRELRNEIARAVALADGVSIDAGAFSPKVRLGRTGTQHSGRSAASSGGAWPASGTLAQRLDAVEASILRDTLERHRWNKTRAAQELALSRVGLRAKLARHGMAAPPGSGETH